MTDGSAPGPAAVGAAAVGGAAPVSGGNGLVTGRRSGRESVVTVLGVVVVGTCWAVAARGGSTPFLLAVALVQFAVIACWFGVAGRTTRFDHAAGGRNAAVGAAVIGAAAAAAADACAAVWPAGRLGVLLAVLGLALPAMFVHQLARLSSRDQLVQSLGATATLIVVVVCPVALVQLRHQIGSGGAVVSAVVVAAAGAVAVAAVVDAVFAPRAVRVDPALPHGLPGVAGAVLAGAAAGYFTLRSVPGFGAGGGSAARGAYLGACVALLSALLSVAGSMLVTRPEGREAGMPALLRAAYVAVLPLLLIGPAAFLLGLALRS